MIKFPENVKKIAKILSDAGYSAYAVGGCVRDSVLGRTPGDWDMTTSARPEQMLDVFKAANVRTIPTGLKHGTVSVLIDGETYECTTFRIDGDYTDSRHPDKVTFTPNVSDDLKRRDFTVNAMAADPLSEQSDADIVDLFGGREDLKNKIIRCVGDPEKRFEEDALRILRAVRFAAVLGFEIDIDTKNAAKKLRHGLSFVSAERRRVEIEKMLVCDNADYGVSLLFELGLAEFIHKDIRMPSLPLSSLPKIFTLRLAALFGIDAHPELDSMKLSREQETQILRYCHTSNQIKSLEPTGANARRILCLVGELAENWALLRQMPDLARVITEERAKNPCVTIPQLAVHGGDVALAGVAPIDRGSVLKMMLDAVIENPSLNDFDTLMDMIPRYYEERREQ